MKMNSLSQNSLSLRFPFNWKNPYGYLIAFALQYIMVLNLHFFVACAVSTGIGIYLWASTFTLDIKNHIRIVNDIVNLGNSDDNHLRLSKQLYETIEFFTVVKQLSGIKNIYKSVNFWLANKWIKFINRLLRNGSKLVQSIFPILFTWSLITICGGMLLISIETVKCRILCEFKLKINTIISLCLLIFHSRDMRIIYSFIYFPSFNYALHSV